MSENVLDFDAKRVPLSGTNLIEASAGTGKTYSIAVLVLRMLLELDVSEKEGGREITRNISIKEILMVTFTKAAVAELEERVRKFIRKAYLVTQGIDPGDKNIFEIVQYAIGLKGETEVINRLHEAVTFLDESSVQTIHSFCQQMLREFAFETRQSFSVELVTDMSAAISSELNRFWRTQITVMPLDILQFFGSRLNRENLKKVMDAYFGGKPIYDFEPGRAYLLDERFFEDCRKRGLSLQENIEALKVAMLEICAHRGELEAACKSDSNARKTLLSWVDQPVVFLEVFIAKCKSAKPPAYLRKYFEVLMDLVDQMISLEEEQELVVFECLHHIYAAAISFVGPAIHIYKEKHGQLGFDDLIEQLHDRLCKESNPVLIKAIRKKYKAVFIDEFQDTDRMQYEIFNTAFGEKTVVFYIGDPKQSIYAFRKADIDTYLKAGEQVEHKYGMHVNYRSSNDFIAAMNQFFMPVPDFDTFYYRGSSLSIKYHLVNAPDGNKKGELQYRGKAFPVVGITEQPNAAAITNALTAQVADLLGGDYMIAPSGEDARPVRPTDIGILVRKNKDAMPIKMQLSKIGIPSVVIGNAKILQSHEATEVLYVLEAIMEPSRISINKALLTSITGMDLEEVLSQNDVITIDRFASYKIQWEKEGVYKALFSFIADYDIETYLTSPAVRGGERVISNLYQLIELLYKQHSNKQLSAAELTDWLRRSIEDPSAQGDEYEQRIESDAACVTIITVHKSKGLQYNIVLTSGMDLVTLNGKETFLTIKNKGGKEETLPRALVIGDDLEAYEQQKMQENRRMIYVTLTRAVYSCFIFTSTAPGARAKLAIYDFLEAFKNGSYDGIRFFEPPVVPEDFRYHKDKGVKSVRRHADAQEVYFELAHRDWRRLSYTFLATAPALRGRYELRQVTDDYDQFVFQQLRRGSITGNLLHNILEHIYFEQSGYWASTIKKAVARFAPHEKERYEPMLLEMARHVAEAVVITGDAYFTLKETDNERRLHEFEFDFPVSPFTRRELGDVLGEAGAFQLVLTEGWEGMMNGKIDMLFECRGKYYVLDWKSTYLGGGLEDYQPGVLKDEMSAHNYHLQYLIYTVATVKYLRDRLGSFDYDRDFGGVLYYFLRGVRSGSASGIYYVKPQRSQIDHLMDLWSGRTADETGVV